MRDTTKLHPTLQTKLTDLKSRCKKEGLIIGIGDCVRSVAEQNALYAKGRTQPGPKVTNANGSTYSSMHQWGVAFDFYRNDGKGAFYDNDGFFAKVGKIGKKCGLEWGGDWKCPKDQPHFQLPDWGSTPSKLKSLYGTPEKFFATWSGSTTSDIENGEEYDMRTIKNGSTGDIVKVWQIIVGVSPDGSFGSKTESATKKWQKAHSLSADGIVGSKSWKEGLASL